MPNGNELNELMEFENHFKEKLPDERLLFIAQQTYYLTNKVDSLNIKFDDCISGNTNNKKTSAVSGGISGGIMAGIALLIEYLRGSK